MKLTLESTQGFMRDSARKAVKRVENMGASQAEAFFSASRTTEVTIRNSEIFTENAVIDAGVGFRVATADNQVGFACTNLVSTERDVVEAAEKAFAIAKLSAPVPDFALPAAQKAAQVRDLYDGRVDEVGVEDTVDIARRMIKTVENADKRITAKGGQVSFSSTRKGIVNSYEVDLEDKGTQVFAYVWASGSQHGEATPACYDLELRRSVGLDPEQIGKNVAQMVKSQFNPKPAEDFGGTVIFGPEAVSNQLVDAIVNALNAEKVAARESPWADKIGETVTSDSLTVVDDGILERGFGSRSCDDEGQRSQRTLLISNGKLQSFMHSATTAKHLKMANTGNASRFGSGLDMVKQIIGTGYKAKPEVSPSNLMITPGRKKQEEIVSEVRRGILVESMAGFVQAGSGLVSAQLARAHFIEDGEVRWPLKGGMISGVAFDWFNRIRDVGSDAKRFVNSVVPSLYVENAKIVGAH
jgi:predicted Zn-dependent protease